MISNTPDKPCKACGHRWDEHFEYVQTRYDDNSRCRVVSFKMTGFQQQGDSYIQKCKCYEYQEIPNLQYLEYLYEKKLCK